MPEWVELEGRHTPVLYNGRVSTDHLITFLYSSLHPALDSLSGQLIFFVRRRNDIREEKRNRRCFLVAKYELGGEQKIKASIRTTCNWMSNGIEEPVAFTIFRRKWRSNKNTERRRWRHFSNLLLRPGRWFDGSEAKSRPRNRLVSLNYNAALCPISAWISSIVLKVLSIIALQREWNEDEILFE